MDAKKKISSFAADAGKNAKNLFEKSKDLALKTIDQNDDGKFDLEDVSEMAETIGGAVKKTTDFLKESAAEKSRTLELKTLSPIFPDTLEQAEFLMPNFIRITERDKKRAESEVCQGSIGYYSSPKDIMMVNIFSDSITSYGLHFYPDAGCGFYYIDPCDRDRYIALDEYFIYLKNAKVNELQKIAQDLGAKHFRITFKEDKLSQEENKGKAQAKVKGAGMDAEVSYKEEKSESSHYSVEAELDFPGHDPAEPKLKYLRNDPTIQNLISMRMDPSSPTNHQKVTIQMSNTTGLKGNAALKVDAVLKSLKCSEEANVAKQASAELKRFLVFEIDF